MTPILAVDLGTSEICALIGVADREEYKALAVTFGPAKGMDKGLVVDVDEAASAAKAVVSEAFKKAGVSVGHAYVAVAGGHAAATISTGLVTVIAANKVITEADRRASLEDAVRKAAIPPDNQVVHVIPVTYSVDGGAVVERPVGLAASILEAQVCVAAGLSTSLANADEVLHRAGLGVDGIVLKPVASALGAIEEHDRAGAVLVDLGAGTSSLACFAGTDVAFTAQISAGGNHITKDLALGLKLGIEEAESLKREFGGASGDNVDDMDFIELPGGEEGKVVSKRYLCQIIEARLAELLTVLRDELVKVPKETCAPARILLTGGTSSIPGIEELASSIFSLPVERAKPISIPGFEGRRRASPTATGLFLYALEHKGDGLGSRALPPTAMQALLSRFAGWLEKRNR